MKKDKATKVSRDDRLSRFLRKEAILDLAVDSKEGLLRSLAEVVVEGADDETLERIYQGIEEREAAVNTYIANGVAIPHARVDCVEGLSLALARNVEGFPYGIDTDEPVRLAILVVGNEALQSEHVRVLGLIAGLFKDREFCERVLSAPDANAVLRLLDSGRATGGRRRPRPRPLTQILLSHARRLAREVGAASVLVAIETQEELKMLRRLRQRDSFIVVTRSAALAERAEKVVDRVLQLPQFPMQTDSKVRLTALMALTHGLIRRGDTVAFLSANDGGGLDTLTVLEVGREFGRFFRASGEISKGIQPAPLEQVIALATELGAQGREGHPVGALFVLVRDEEIVKPHAQQMVMNPFRGYPEEERNILDPTLAETLKEFASLDGAFVIRGDGVVLSAGTYLSVDEVVELEGGYGSRHRSACAITKAIDCVTVTLSQSTGEVTVFSRGAVVVKLPPVARVG